MEETLPQIITTRSEDETCAQFVFGPEHRFVDNVYYWLLETSQYKLDFGPPAIGQVVVYCGKDGFPAHVGKIVEGGLVESKFYGDPNVYRHQEMGNPIPKDPENFQYTRRYRKIETNPLFKPQI